MIALYAVTITASLSAIIGASKFVMGYIHFAGFIYMYQMAFSIWSYISLENWIALGIHVGVTLLWVYPHAVFLWEVDSGVFTKARYEPQSICCDVSSRAMRKADKVQDAFPFGGGL